MRLGTALIQGNPRLVADLGERGVVDLAAANAALGVSKLPTEVFRDMQGFVEAGAEAVAAAEALLKAVAAAPSAAGVHELSEIRLLAPIPKPAKNIVCVGRNYKEHVKELKALRGTAADIPEHPIFFTKSFTTVVGPGAAVRVNRTVTNKVDYEGELAIVIGKQGTNIPVEQAMEHVFGYTLMNDVSARDVQYRHVQYYKGKSLDTFGPMGPWILHKSAVPDYRTFRLETRVNGELRQTAGLDELIFDLPVIISVLSAGITLHPGDVIATGTPSGVGGSFDPQKFLLNGDVVEVSVPEIGLLRNVIQDEAV